MALHQSVLKCIREVAGATKVGLPSDFEDDSFASEAQLTSILDKQDLLLREVFSKYASSSVSTELAFPQVYSARHKSISGGSQPEEPSSFVAGVGLTDKSAANPRRASTVVASEKYINYHSFVSLCTHLSIHPGTINNDLLSNFLLLRIFAACSKDYFLEKNGVSSLNWRPATKINPLDVQSVSATTFANMADKADHIRHLFRKHCEVDLASSSSSDQQQPSSPFHENPLKVRSLLHAAGENPPPGEFQLLMTYLSTAYTVSQKASKSAFRLRSSAAIDVASISVSSSSSTGSPDAPRSRTPLQHPHAKLASPGSVGEDDFVQCWQACAQLSIKASSYELALPDLRIAFSVCAFFATDASPHTSNDGGGSLPTANSPSRKLGEYRQSGAAGQSLANRLDKILRRLAAEQLAFAGSGDDADIESEEGEDEEDGEGGRPFFRRVLERVFDIYAGAREEEGTLSFDLFKVYLRDSGLYKKLLSSHDAITTLLHDKLLMEFHEDFTKKQFIEANEVFLKENLIRSSLPSTSSSAPGPSAFNTMSTSQRLTPSSLTASYDTASSRLLALFSVYEMPSRLSTYQTAAISVKLSSSPRRNFPSALRRRSRSSSSGGGVIAADLAHSHAHPLDFASTKSAAGYVVDLWEGTRISRRPTAPGSGDVTIDNRGKNMSAAGTTGAEARRRMLTLIVDNSLIKPLGGGSGDRPEADLAAADKEGNVGRSIFDVSQIISTVDDEEIAPPSSILTVLSSSPVLSATHHHFHKRGSSTSQAGAHALDLPHGHGNDVEAHNAEAGQLSHAAASEDESRDSKHKVAGLASGGVMSPAPPRTMNSSHSGCAASRKGKAFKKVYGLGRGVQHFTPRMTTSSRDRLKFAKQMAKSTKLLSSMNLHFPSDSGEGTVDYSKELPPDASYAAHPSYKLYEDGTRLKKTRPDQAIILWEKALAMATSMPNNVSLYHRLHLYDSLVTLCLANKRLEHATDLMEAHLELIRQFTPDRTLEVRVMNKLGKTHFALGNYEESETCHALQQTLAYQIFDQRGEMQAFQGQGLALYGMRRFEEACAMFKRYLDIAEEGSDKREVANAYSHLGMGHFEDENLSEAFVSFKEQIIKLREVLNLTPGDRTAAANMAAAFANLAKVYRKWGKAPLCANALGKSLKLSRDLKNDRMEAEASFNLARILVELRLGVDLSATPKFIDRVPKGGVGSPDFSLNAVGKSLIIPIFAWKQTGWFAHLNVLREFLTVSPTDLLASRSLESLRQLINSAIDNLSRALQLCRGKDDADGDAATGLRPKREMALDATMDMAGLFYLSGRKEEGAKCYDNAREILDEMEDLELMDSRSLRQHRVNLALFEGVYLVFHGSWAPAKKKFEYLISTLTAINDNTEMLAGSKMMYGWCMYYLGEVEACIVVFESSLECYDAMRSVESKALTLSSLAYVTFTKWQSEVRSRGEHFDGEAAAASDDGLIYTRELLGECFTIGAESDSVMLQILALERLAEVHEAVGEADIAEDLLRRSFGLRGAAGDEAGKSEMLAKMEIKKAVGGMELLGGTSQAPQWMD